MIPLRSRAVILAFLLGFLPVLAPAEEFLLQIGELVTDGAIGATPTPGAGTIDSENPQDIYRFSGTTGQRVYFDSLIPGNCGQFSWYIRMPSGDGLNGGTPDLCSDIGTITLPQTGTYTLYVYALGAGTGTYQFRLMDVDAEAIPIAIGDTVSDGVPVAGAGRLPAPARIQAYTFTGTTGQRVYFDSLIPGSCGQFAWYIRMPSGDGLNGGTPDLCSDIGTITLPQSGTYTLYVYALGTGTGSYQFRIMDVDAEAIPIALGDTVSDGVPVAGAGRLPAPARIQTYTFIGTTGQRVYFDSLMPGNCGQFAWYIRMPSGDGLNGGTPDLCSDIGTITLPQTGTYTLYVYALGTGTGTYQFRLVDVDAEAIPITIGDTVSDGVPVTGAGRLPAPARIQAYTFTGTTGQRVYFDSLMPGSCGQFAWYIRMPSGDGLNGGTPDLCSDIGTITLPQTGTYTLYVYALGTGTGTYQFRLVDVDAEAIPITIGDTVSDGVPVTGAGRLPAPAQIQAYTFTGTTGQRVYFDSLMPSSCGQFAWYIRMPSGDGLNGGTPDLCSDIGTITLPQTGTYTLYVYALGTGTGTYQFRLVDVDAEAIPIAIGDTVSDGVPVAGAGRLPAPARIQAYTFTGTTGQRVYFDSLIPGSCGQFAWYIRMPSGDGLNGGTPDLCSDIGTITLPQSGTYTLYVYALGTGTGTYQFRLMDVDAEAIPIAIGDTVSDSVPLAGAGRLPAPARIQAYTFTGTTGQRVYFDSLMPSSCGQFAWYIRMPSGDGLNGGTPDLCSDIGTIILPQSGTYTLYVYALGTGTGTYQFRIMDVDAEAIPIAIGDTVSDGVPLAGAGRLPAPARIQAYTFTGTTGRRVYFDSLMPSSCGQFAWYIRMPSGDGLNGGTPDLCSDIGTITLPQTGTYTLYVFALGDGTGTYSFKLNSLRAPVAGDDVAATVVDRAVNLPVVRLLANDSDPDLDTLSITLPGNTTQAGGSLALSGGSVQYHPPSGFDGVDTFNYQVEDGLGQTDIGTVTVTVRRPELLGRNTISAARESDGSLRLRMAGIPGRNYQVWFATDLAGVWSELATVAADETGLVQFTDTSAIGIPVRFYRLAETP